MWDEIFEPPPEQWGLRGDPYLWEAMRDRLSGSPLPEAAGHVRQRLAQVFEELVGVPANPYLGVEHVHVESFAHGGMSSGSVDLRTWHDRLLPLLHARAAERVGDQPRPGMAGRPLRGPADVEALLRRFEFGDAVVRRVELHLPAAGRAHGQVQLEVQERCDEEWRWTTIVFVVDGLQAFRLTQGRTAYQVLTGPPVIVQAPDGTWVVDLARDRELQEPPAGRWYDSPQFLQGSDVSWHCSPSRREPEDAARLGGVHGDDDEGREGGPAS